jgi:hypothetical protein
MESEPAVLVDQTAAAAQWPEVENVTGVQQGREKLEISAKDATLQTVITVTPTQRLALPAYPDTTCLSRTPASRAEITAECAEVPPSVRSARIIISWKPTAKHVERALTIVRRVLITTSAKFASWATTSKIPALALNATTVVWRVTARTDARPASKADLQGTDHANAHRTASRARISETASVTNA